jgi:hypothetical protein
VRVVALHLYVRHARSGYEAPRGPSTCEIDVRLGESYLVFALPRGERELQTHRCDGTTLGALAGNAVSTLTRLGLRVPEG